MKYVNRFQSCVAHPRLKFINFITFKFIEEKEVTMEINIIKGMIHNSTWIDTQKGTIYSFSENNQLSIDGKNHIQYELEKRNNQFSIKLGSSKMYVVDYVCDFILNIHSNDERFTISPD